MAKEFTDKSRYKSAYTESWVTAAQYIAELVCENIAQKRSETLPLKFWNDRKWNATFRRQLSLANGLLKIYSEAAVIQALRTKEGKRISSLAAPWLDDIIERCDKVKRQETKIQTVEKKEGIRPSVPKKGSIWELDNDS